MVQKGSEFIRGTNSHHGPEVSLNDIVCISVKVKAKASENPYKSATEIGKEVRANSEPIQDLISYMENQWLNHPIFDFESWSVFRITVRTNNDVEGKFKVCLLY